MDKNAIKKFAVWARTELIARVSLKGVEYGITEDSIEDANADSIGGKVLTTDEKKQRQALIAEINDKGYEQVMEEVAYTWFNRFSALRFMEVNGYLPSHVRVFTDEENNFKPQIITEAIHMDLDGLDMEKVYELKDAEKTEELYKYLLIVQCNALNKILPGMFQKIADYTELLLPDNLLREGSVIQQMIELIPEEDWKDAVQIIGWLYQYYNSEKKDDVFAALKKNVKITKENIPAATQLFTPDWIVRYMVENSLGRLWLEGHPDVKEQLLPTEEEQSAYAAGNRDPEDTKWHYYLEEAEQEPEVQTQLAEIRKEYAALTPDQLKVIDPCSGSGHILAYMFDVLMKIYESYGYTTREAVASIVENNLYGLDIDDRAAQLAYFAVMMKARQYDRRFFSRGIQPHVYAIVESNHVDKFAVDYFCNGDVKLTVAMDTIIKELHDAKEYGSIVTVTPQDWSVLYDRFAEITLDINMSRETALRELLPLVQVAEIISEKYSVVVTNPPYRGIGDVEAKLQDFVKEKYPDSCSDLSTVFMEKCIRLTTKNGYYAMINIPVWMSLASYSNLRNKMLCNEYIVNMLHLGRGMFGSDYGTTAFVVSNTSLNRYKGFYKKFFERQGAVETEEAKQKKFFYRTKDYATVQELYLSLPNDIIAYWATKSFADAFESGININTYATVFEGLKTRDKDRFLRFWFEVASKKWKPYAKGGTFRRWYGNNDYVVNWGENGDEVRNFKKSSGANFKHYFEPEITYTAMTMSKFTGRYITNQLFGGGGGGITASAKIDYLLGFVNSLPFDYIISAMKSTVNFEVGQIGKIPVLFGDSNSEKSVAILAQENVGLSKQEWDSYEYSWDFQHHPLLRKVSTIAEAFEQWQTECDNRFNQLKTNEEELNRIFIDIYGLQEELTPEVEDKDVTVRKADLGRDIRSFISYAVGCMFGRYSLDIPGLVYAGGNFDEKYCRWISQFGDQANEKIDADGLLIEGGWAGSSLWKYDGVRVGNQWCKASYPPDTDNIIPICDDEYFEDDIVGLFVEFVKTVYGADTLDENLKFIADALDSKGQPKDVIRNYFLNDFYKDHCKIYQKRPIYWLFDSGKKNGFKALIYMHRYQPDTIARIRTDYVHEQQARYRTAIVDLEQRSANASTGERVKLKKKLTTLQAQDTEIRIYEEKIHHLADQMISIDLDDGVKKNYAIFQDVLAKIK
ncbi:BREX-1 system adenine-specific DNA-methyltransferase PglX [Blautia sp. MSK20_18]|uniref:BREX-1 system adenine-specific DNA-methyltransferase PglX n=1 Tax=Blautia sp. MSK20_18 TaxID=2883186 RepID=UPI0022379967|nr:BREX-1 system adenine-specific DNA-methyltransferase PglX [Blautia sp. MSK20_18]MCB7506158.1 BREX-1 system adenine-specific DNA-methyltransferase PglX [Blautia sp. MSK20_18]